MAQQDSNTDSVAPKPNGKSELETTGLCLLSLDGGGVRGLSALYILRSIMDRLNYERDQLNLDAVRPCEIFDLIGGTSTGGLIAIMLGRLEMDVDKCIEAYKGLMKGVFERGNRNWFLRMVFTRKIKLRLSSAALEEAIKGVIKGPDGQRVDPPFYEKAKAEDLRKCKVFVCAKAKEINRLTLLRSYHIKGQPRDPITISQAALATSAATTFFDPVEIDGRQYVDGAMGANNPSQQVEREVSNIWCENRGNITPLVKCFISVGTGNGGLHPISDKAWEFLTETLKEVATDTKKTEDDVASRWREQLNRRYFRFNVQQGLQEVGLAEYDKGPTIAAATEDYLKGQEMQFQLQKCVGNLLDKKYSPTQRFCKEQAMVHAQEKPIKQENRKNLTAHQISELMDRANRGLKTPRNMITHVDLINAHNDFLRVFRAHEQQPPATPKELTYVCNKLMTTSLRLSHFLNFTPEERMAHVQRANKFGKLALENAFKTQNTDRIAQMRFYFASVKAREIQLKSSVEGFKKPTPDERKAAERDISDALAQLGGIKDLDMSVYDALAKETLDQLR